MVLGWELDLDEAAWGSAIEVAADSQKAYKGGAFTKLSLKILDSVNKKMKILQNFHQFKDK